MPVIGKKEVPDLTLRLFIFLKNPGTSLNLSLIK